MPSEKQEVYPTHMSHMRMDVCLRRRAKILRSGFLLLLFEELVKHPVFYRRRSEKSPDWQIKVTAAAVAVAGSYSQRER